MQSSKLLWLTLLYGIQGVPYGFQVTFLPVLLHSSGTSLTKVSLMRMLNLPWMLKILWAPLVTKSQTITQPLKCSLAGLAVIFALTSFIPSQSIWLLSVSLLVINLLVSVQDIAVDTFAIQSLSSDQELGAGNAIQVVAYKFGAMLGGGILTWASQYYTWKLLMSSVSIVYLLVTLVIHVALSDRSTRRPIENCRKQDNMRSKKMSERMNKHLKLAKLPEISHNSARDGHDDNVITHRYNLRSGKIVGELKPSLLIGRGDKPQLLVPDPHNKSDQVSELESEVSCRENKRELDQGNDTSCSSTSSAARYCSVNEKIRKEENGSTDKGLQMSLLQTIIEDFDAVLKVPNTKWLIIYLIIYKLGEQGAVSIFPLYLIDGSVSTNQVAVWTGMVSQWTSITGSLLGGWVIGHSKQMRTLPLKLVWLSLSRSVPLAILSVLMQIMEPGKNSNYIILCTPLYLVLLTGGAITTATFTLMMTTSKGAHIPSTQTLHHTTMATAEVLGKVSFTALAGVLVDSVGYNTAFYFFAFLSVLPFLPLFKLSQNGPELSILAES